MRKALIAVAIVSSLATAVVAQSDRTIVTTGQGTFEMVPDMASLNVSVTHQAEQAGEALALTSDALRAVIARLEEAGVEGRDMQSQGVSLQPLWNRQMPGVETTPRITGFVARNGLMIRVRALEGLGEILDTVVRDGANTFDGLQFLVQDPSAAQAAARADAVRDAMDKAQQLADAAGVTLGPIQSISEIGGRTGPVMMEMASPRMAADVPIAGGEVSLTVQVSMVFSIAND